MMKFIKEACVEKLSQVENALRKGADRIELCDRLDLGGTTPSRDLILAAKRTGIVVRVMIRPRGGDFQYSQEELDEMAKSIEFCKNSGVDGVVFGMQQVDRELDYELIEEFAALAAPLNVIIHKVIDETPDPVKSVKNLRKITNVTGVLTSGGNYETALEGKDVLQEMIRVGGNLEIVPAGKITEKNIFDLHQMLGAKSYHGKLIVGEI